MLLAPAALATDWMRVPTSELLAQPVMNLHGESVGEIEDLVVDLARSHVYYAVVRSAGWAGADARYHAVPVQALKPVADGSGALLQAEFDALPELPQFGADWQPRRGVRASELLNRPARSVASGLLAGEIEDVVVDLRGARILHVVFDRDGQREGDRMYLAPHAFALPAGANGDAVVNLRGRRISIQ